MAGLAASRTFQDLLVWQKAHQFVLAAYQYSSGFPKAEVYGLVSQFRRAAVSIPANIAEGFCRRGDLDKVRFMNIAQSYLEECRYYLILSNDLGYGANDLLKRQIDEVGRMLSAYVKGILAPGS